MAIVKMKKFHLLVLDSHREKLLHELQLFRNVQFEDTSKNLDFQDDNLKSFTRINYEESLSKVEDEMSKCQNIIDMITKYTPSTSSLKGFIEGLPNYTFEEMEEAVEKMDFEYEYQKVKAMGDELANIDSSISKNREKIKEIKPFINLDTSFSSLHDLKNFKAITGSVSGKIVSIFKEELDKIDYLYYEEVGVYKDDHIFFIIYDLREEDEVTEALRIGNMTVVNDNSTSLPSQEVEQLNKQIEELSVQKGQKISEIAKMQRELADFKLKYEYLGNLKVRLLSQKEFMSTKRVCALSGYCPEFEMDRLENTIKSVSSDDYTLEFEDVDRNSDDIPILLKNNRFARIFENVTSTYALPKYNEIDPTPLYAPIYALFFGMMSADFGYGFSLVLLTTLALKFCNLSPDMKKNVKFFQLIGISTSIWGILYGSYFGASIPGMWRMFDLSKQFMTILVISIIMGGIHLFYGLAIKAYMQVRDGMVVDMFFDVIAWYITLISIIVLLLSVAGVLGTEFKNPSLIGMVIGIILLIIGGARNSSGNIIARFVAGLYNVYGLSGYIGDFVSYSRLMALGMSGGYIAFSVNMIAGMVWGKTVIGYVAAIIILVLFHAFNLFLSCLGAYVHALRLIYVEFFGKFYEGGGKAFQFFRNKPKYINLDRHYED